MGLFNLFSKKDNSDERVKNMFTIHRKEMDFAGTKLVLETGHIARQATGSVMVTLGETMVLVTAVGSKTAVEGQDFFPLTVHYQEKYSAAGKIPGGFNKRESKPSDAETLTARLIDRPIRPLFAESFTNEVQVIATVFSYDKENSADIAAIIGASAALSISGMPFLGPIAASRVGYIDGKYVLNPKVAERSSSALDLVVAGTKDGVLMVESEAQELSEEVMLGAVNFGFEAFQPVIKLIEELKAEAGKAAWPEPTRGAAYEGTFAKIAAGFKEALSEAYEIRAKLERQDKIAEIKSLAKESLGEDEDALKVFDVVFENLNAEILRGKVMSTKTRIDGRDTKTVRPILAEIDVLPRVHGSALFTRGETQALVSLTLGTTGDGQRVDSLDGEGLQDFMLHYNFPPYSVGESGRVGAPGRREIGHGKLAWRAIHPMLPNKEDFPYTIRLISEITESNGSSSMATVCGSTLALLAGGVPLVKPVAGIAMGLIKEGKDFVVLTDILGDEDHLGDMDFKVAGTKDGVTALQMDIKITSITSEIMEVALKQANEGRMHILGEMARAISEPAEMSEYAPRIYRIMAPVSKLGELIGPGGKMIKSITEKSGSQIDISDDGTVLIAATSEEGYQIANEMINCILFDPEVGKVYDGTVVKIADFGAFVNFYGSKDGLVHISEITDEKRVEKVDEYLKVGDKVKVKLLAIDNQGKFKLSIKKA